MRGVSNWTLFGAVKSFLMVALVPIVLGACHSSDVSSLSPDVDPDLDVPADQRAVAKLGDVLLIGGGTQQKVSTKTAELFDPATKAFALTGSLATARTAPMAVGFKAGPLLHQILVGGGLSGGATLSGSDDLNFNGGPLATAQLYKNSDASFHVASAMRSNRLFGTMTLLQNGQVLITGGFGGTTSANTAPVNTAELFNPATGAFTMIPAHMHSPRALHTATLLNNGKVLIVGGVATRAGGTVATAELYNPSTRTFTPTVNSLPGSDTPSAAMTATLIAGCGCSADGKVLIAGGFNGFTFGRTLETATTAIALYDPATNRFSNAGLPTMKDDRMFHSATLLPGGKVLLAGGFFGQSFFSNGTIGGVYGGILNSAEIYDARTNHMTCLGGIVSGQCAGRMRNARAGHTATLMPSGPLAGRILLAGGIGGPTKMLMSGNVLNTAEYFNPGNNSFTATGTMKSSRTFQAAALIQ